MFGQTTKTAELIRRPITVRNHKINNLNKKQQKKTSVTCDVQYVKEAAKVHSATKHYVTIDNVKYTYTVNELGITKEKVKADVAQICRSGSLEIHPGISKGWN